MQSPRETDGRRARPRSRARRLSHYHGEQTSEWEQIAGGAAVWSEPKETAAVDIRDFAMDFFSLEDKNSIATGGNTGLGQAFALALAKGGANVFVPSIIDDDGVTGQMMEAVGSRYEFMKTDITAPGAPAQIVDASLGHCSEHSPQ